MAWLGYKYKHDANWVKQCMIRPDTIVIRRLSIYFTRTWASIKVEYHGVRRTLSDHKSMLYLENDRQMRCMY